MSGFDNPLRRVRVAAPCAAEWERMRGDERVRFCDQCSLNVYNLSGMTRREAEALLSNAEGRLCVRFYRRADGTILTDNCPVGLRALKRRVSRVASAALSAVVSFFAGLGVAAGYDLFRSLNSEETTGTLEVIREPVAMGAITARPVQRVESSVEMGESVRPASDAVMGRLVSIKRLRAGRRGRS